MKNKIGIASRTYNIAGAVVIDPLPDQTAIRDIERRVSRTKTLDGGCYITDGGIADGDRTFTIAMQSSATLWELIRGIMVESWVTVSTDEACFLAKIKSIAEADGKIKINILIKEKLTA